MLCVCVFVHTSTVLTAIAMTSGIVSYFSQKVGIACV